MIAWLEATQKSLISWQTREGAHNRNSKQQHSSKGEADSSISNEATVTRSRCLYCPDDPSATPDGAIPKKGESSGNAASWKEGSAPGEADRRSKKGRESAWSFEGEMSGFYRCNGRNVSGPKAA